MKLLDPEQFFRDYKRRAEKTVIGLHSGTSTDGVEAAVVRVSGSGDKARAELVHHCSREYPAEIQDRLIELSDKHKATVDKVCQANVVLGELFAEAAKVAASGAGLDLSDVTAIASSGQIVYHARWGQFESDPWIGDSVIPSAIDLADATVISERTGVSTVTDLRIRDMVVGGQGNPLVTYGDWVLFRSEKRSRAIQNIGGIANPTILPAGGDINSVIAFDTGPGNMITNALMKHFTNSSSTYDHNGEFAASGSVHEGLLSELLQHEYILREPPKTTGREVFGQPLIEKIIRRGNELGISPQDLVATSTALSAASIGANFEKFVLPQIDVHEMYLCGGGTYNTTLVGFLKEYLPNMAIRTTADLGVPVGAREACCVAVIGNESFLGAQGNVPSATGASKPVVMGKMAFGYPA